MICPAISTVMAAGWLSILCGSLLRMTLGYGLFWIVARFATSAALRFRVWLAFLAMSAALWLSSIGQGTRMLYQSSVAPAPAGAAASLHAPVFLSAHVAILVGLGLRIALAGYLVILTVLLLAAAWKQVVLRRVLRFRVAPPATLASVFIQVAAEIASPPSELWILPGLASPASLGWLRPAVYLPADECEGAPEQMRAVFVHELSHLRRRDAMWDLLARTCRALLFFHPLVHTAFAAMRFERELACDALVVQRDPLRRDLYADVLVRFGWKSTNAGMPDRVGIGFTSQARVLHVRVQAVLSGERSYSRQSSAVRVLLSTAAFFIFAAIVPTLWIGFSLPSAFATVRSTSPERYAAAPPIAKGSTRKTPAGAHLTSASGLHTSENRPGVPTEDVPLTPHTTNHSGFHVQNEEEPMSNPRDGISAATTPDLSGPSAHGMANRPPMPSPAAMAVDTAMQLSRMGIGRDHDRD